MSLQGVITVSEEMIDALEEQAESAANRRARLCLHDHPAEAINEMILVMCRDSYICPHRHPFGKPESYCVIRGEMDVIIYNDDGGVIERIEMGVPGSGKIFHYRLAEPLWHSPVPRTDAVAFIEVFAGPFNKSADVEYAPWAEPE